LARWIVVLCLLAACAEKRAASPEAPAAPAGPAAGPDVLALPGGEGGIGFDDLQWSAALGRLLVPAGRTGALDLVDPMTGAVEQIPGFGGQGGTSAGHGDGCTSAVDGLGWLFAIDRSRGQLDVVDPARRAIVAQAELQGGPDYVRCVPAARELWVTEPSAEQIEVFRLAADGAPTLERVAVIAVPGGPESLVIDATRSRAYTHLWTDTTVVIDLARHTIVARWPNGCTGSRGIALDEARGWLFVGCDEGRTAVLDVAQEGRLLGSALTGAGVDIIAYDAARRHLYVPGDDGTLTILGVPDSGRIGVLETQDIRAGAQGVATDGAGRIFVGDPYYGRILVIEDELPAGMGG